MTPPGAGRRRGHPVSLLLLLGPALVAWPGPAGGDPPVPRPGADTPAAESAASGKATAARPTSDGPAGETSAAGTSAARLAVEPPQVLLASDEPFSLTLRGVAGEGPAAVAVNVGRVLSVSGEGARVQVRLAPPARRHPQLLVLLVWRPGVTPPRLQRVDVPLLGQKTIKVHTRPGSTVEIEVAGRRFGPQPVDERGNVRVAVEVPPGTARAVTRVTDSAGLESRKTLSVDRPWYPPITVAAVPHAAGDGSLRLHVRVVSATTPPRGVRATVEGAHVPLGQMPRGDWAGEWVVPDELRGQAVTVWAWHRGLRRTRRSVGVRLALPAPPDEPAVAASSPTSAALAGAPVVRAKTTPEPWLSLTLGLGAGLLANTGELLSPLFRLDVGLHYALPVGRLGLVAAAAVSWDSQQVSAPAGGAAADSSLTLLPLSVGLTYRKRVGPVFPALEAGFAGQLLWHSAGASGLETRRTTHFAPGFYALLGLDYPVGPGALSLQGGLSWARVDEPALTLLAGGAQVQLGYRLDFGLAGGDR